MIQQTYHATMTIKLDINHNSESEIINYFVLLQFFADVR